MCSSGRGVLNYNELCFMEDKFCRQRNIVFPPTEFQISLKNASGMERKRYMVVIEAINTLNLVQFRMTDINDQLSIFISTIDTGIYDNLKSDQSLHVSFSTFVDNLGKMLDNCRRGIMEMSLIESKNVLQFIETREFKNLIHLIIPVKIADVAVVFFHVRRELDDIWKKIETYKNEIAQLQNTLSLKDAFINKLESELQRNKEYIKEYEETTAAQTCEKLYELEECIMQLTESKKSQERRLKTEIAELQSTIDRLQKENSILYEKTLTESRRMESVREDICLYKCKAIASTKQNERFSAEVTRLRNNKKTNEMQIKNLGKEISDLREHLEKQKKANSNLIAELEAERKANNAKRDAILTASEEITKAKETVAKQGEDILNLRQNIELRTDIVLKQEVCVREKENQLFLQRDTLEHLQNKLENIEKYPEKYSQCFKYLMEALDRMCETYSKTPKLTSYCFSGSNSSGSISTFSHTSVQPEKIRYRKLLEINRSKRMEKNTSELPTADLTYVA